jgi:hypothetical protein
MTRSRGFVIRPHKVYLNRFKKKKSSLLIQERARKEFPRYRWAYLLSDQILNVPKKMLQLKRKPTIKKSPNVLKTFGLQHY